MMFAHASNVSCIVRVTFSVHVCPGSAACPASFPRRGIKALAATVPATDMLHPSKWNLGRWHTEPRQPGKPLCEPCRAHSAHVLWLWPTARPQESTRIGRGFATRARQDLALAHGLRASCSPRISSRRHGARSDLVRVATRRKGLAGLGCQMRGVRRRVAHTAASCVKTWR